MESFTFMLTDTEEEEVVSQKKRRHFLIAKVHICNSSIGIRDADTNHVDNEVLVLGYKRILTVMWRMFMSSKRLKVTSKEPNSDNGKQSDTSKGGSGVENSSLEDPCDDDDCEELHPLNFIMTEFINAYNKSTRVVAERLDSSVCTEYCDQKACSADNSDHPPFEKPELQVQFQVLMKYHSLDKRLTYLMMMVLVRQAEEYDMMLHIEKSDMLMLVAKIEVGDKTVDDVDKLACAADVVKPRQVDLKFAYASF
nr:hypothetical protein [Tanacetum cinerariifolium]